VTEDLTRLKATLAQLHAELEKVEPGDPEIRELLDGAVADIQQAMHGRQNTPLPQDASIIDRLGEAARHYEERHPQLSSLLGNISAALSRLGI
jgi:hypothetical protein